MPPTAPNAEPSAKNMWTHQTWNNFASFATTPSTPLFVHPCLGRSSIKGAKQSSNGPLISKMMQQWETMPALLSSKPVGGRPPIGTLWSTHVAAVKRPLTLFEPTSPKSSPPPLPSSATRNAASPFTLCLRTWVPQSPYRLQAQNSTLPCSSCTEARPLEPLACPMNFCLQPPNTQKGNIYSCKPSTTCSCRATSTQTSPAGSPAWFPRSSRPRQQTTFAPSSC